MINVSIIVPCLNEQATIESLLKAIYQQTYPRDEMEVIIADGLSIDNTREVITNFSQTYPDLRVRIVDNEKRNIPSGLNRAIEVAQGKYLLRLDAHSKPYPDYVERCVQALVRGVGDNVGGVWEIKPGSKGWIPASIAFAASHPFGVGDARYRLGGEPQYVETVPFGSYHRSLIERIGFYNEKLLTNEDYEFNVRIRQAGGKIWFDPAIRSIYFARSSLRELMKQYWRYGFWKARMLRMYPNSIRFRQYIPPLFVFSLLFILLGMFFYSSFIILLIVEILIYVIFLLIAGIHAYLQQRELKLLFGVPIAMATMHIAWGSSFLWSIVREWV
jgi:glycosyltransferase involved in cell wall biosynthesis